MKPTDIKNPDYFHKVVDCQWACPAHTPVPEYIRLIAHGRYSDAYMINWKSNVFPGILGRTCDRPCEPACRRSRVEDETLVKGKREPVAICRLKRVAADYKDEDIKARMPKAPKKNGKRRALGMPGWEDKLLQEVDSLPHIVREINGNIPKEVFVELRNLIAKHVSIEFKSKKEELMNQRIIHFKENDWANYVKLIGMSIQGH